MKAKDVKYVFEQNPDLDKIGTKTKYYKYIKSIFPESKVKDIVYHGSHNKFPEFKDPSTSGLSHIWFSEKPLKGQFGENVYSVILNIKNLLNEFDNENYNKELKNYESPINPEWRNNYHLTGELPQYKYDGTIRTSRVDDGRSITVRNPNQVHILGSQKDIEGFKEYVDENKIESAYEKKYNGISVELGRKKEIKDTTGKKSIIQNINVLYKGDPIINQDYNMKNMVLQIFPDINEAVVGNIFLPEEFRGKGLTKYIYQAVADKLNIPIVNSLKRKDRLGEYYNQSEAGSKVWKNKKSFIPNRQTHEGEKSKGSSLENKIISGLFILTFLAGIILTTFNLTGNVVGTSETAHKFGGIILFLLSLSGFFIYKKLRS